MNSPVKQRLIEFLAYEKIGQGAFEMRCGLYNAFVTNIKQSISPDKLLLITQQFPELNAGWLLTGEGEMLKSNAYKAVDQISNTEETIIKEPVSKIETLLKGDSPPPDTIWAALMKLVESNNILIQSNQSLVEAQTMLAQAHRILAETNAKLTYQVENMKESGLPGSAVREKKKAV